MDNYSLTTEQPSAMELPFLQDWFKRRGGLPNTASEPYSYSTTYPGFRSDPNAFFKKPSLPAGISGELHNQSPILYNNPARANFISQNLNDINKVVVHATGNKDAWTDREDLKSVYDWHVNRNMGNSKKVWGIGYHYLIGKDGTVYLSRQPTERGAHAQAQRSNLNSIGISFLGSGENPTEAQLGVFEILNSAVNSQLPSNLEFLRHRDIDPNRTDVPWDIRPYLPDKSEVKPSVRTKQTLPAESNLTRAERFKRDFKAAKKAKLKSFMFDGDLIAVKEK